MYLENLVDEADRLLVKSGDPKGCRLKPSKERHLRKLLIKYRKRARKGKA